MRVLNKIDRSVLLCRYKTIFRAYACIFMSFFLVSCVDDIALPDLSLINKTESSEKVVKPQPSSDIKSKDENKGQMILSDVAVFAPVKKIKTESLLDAKGSWNLVEKSEAIDPMQAHLMARKKVNTKRRKYNKELSPHFEPNAKSGKDGKMRVVRLEPNEDSLDEFEIAESSIAKPTHAVVEGDILQKIKSLFGENDVDSQSYATIVPKRKPSPRIQILDKEKAKSTKTGWNFFSKDKNENKEVGVKPEQVIVKNIKVKDRKKPRPTSSEERMVGGVVLPPELPERRAVDVAVSPREIKRVNEDLVLAPIKDKGEVRLVKPESENLPEGMVIPKRKPINADKFRASALNKIISKPSRANNKVNIQNNYNGSTASVIRLRSGKHTGKTRLVIEVTRTSKYKVMVDHLRNVLRIKLYNTRWEIAPQENFKKSNLLGTYIARGQKDGSTILEIRLKKKTKILDTMILRPNLSSKHRVVIDLKD